ncbi:LysR family transcriptional regulator [Pokkaliibacter plantistimulans]|uniref:LysR family transcriptional regulator n=3 Tax=Pseudomonadota TaxID=1224 RepID=A0ABX5LRZ1_9GAMM|nr:LysR substrate-binding domain-containing protein [Pokkaliibacter plantistimulans]PPC77808.1 LysR family transcriptional regulator [Pokkaliibacter plantistimulans]PXF29409.1 LysR family transcriptional regulator [Pokkaliibacter plantistimulans]
MSGRNQHLPPLKCLATFEAAARHRSFTQAATELNLTQSAVSRQIKRLEHDLGRPLFERDAQGVSLTPAGEQYSQLVQRLLRELAQETALLRRRGEGNQLTIASSPTIASLWLAPRLVQLQNQQPQLEIRILTVEDPSRLDASEYDLGLFYHLPGEIPLNGVESRPLFSEEAVIAICSPGYLHQHGQVTDANALLHEHVLLVLEDHHYDWLTWEDWFHGLGMDWQLPERSLRANSYQLLMNAALAGQGVILGWERLLDWELSSGRLVRVLPQQLNSRGSLCLLQPSHRHPSQATRLFIDWLYQQ